VVNPPDELDPVLEDVTEGRILIAINDVTYTSPKDRDILRWCFQSYALYPNMTVEAKYLFWVGNA